MLSILFKGVKQTKIGGFSSAVALPGKSVYKDNSKDVKLRGTFLKGKYNDLPNLIFLTEVFDSTDSWVKFFSDPDNKFLDYRNVYLLNPRNFGNSDGNDQFDMEQQAQDVIRFMYENQISTATLGGHGLGAKLALATGCYHSERVTGVFCLDSAPVDHRYFDSFVELKNYVQKCRDIKLNADRKDIDAQLKAEVDCPKWRSLFSQNLLKVADKEFKWNFSMELINKNLQFNKADSLGAWNEKFGMFTGRTCYIFPEYSRWVQLNTNTLAMLKVGARTKGFGNDVFAIQGDDNVLNHWVYDFKHEYFVTARKLLKFLTMYDGVHVLLKDRSEVGKGFIPDRVNSRNAADHVYGEYSPAHLHHNWRYSKIYEQSEK